MRNCTRGVTITVDGETLGHTKPGHKALDEESDSATTRGGRREAKSARARELEERPKGRESIAGMATLDIST